MKAELKIAGEFETAHDKQVDIRDLDIPGTGIIPYTPEIRNPHQDAVIREEISKNPHAWDLDWPPPPKIEIQ